MKTRNTYTRFLLKNQEGNAIIEFAILAPVFFLLLMGLLEFSLMFYATNVLENAATASARYGLTGSTYTGSACGGKGVTRDAFIRCSVKRLSSGLLDPEKVIIQTKVYDNYDIPDNITFPNPTQPGQTVDYGAGAKSVLYRISYKWNFFTPLVGDFFPDKSYLISATTLVKNEDF